MYHDEPILLTSSYCVNVKLLADCVAIKYLHRYDYSKEIKTYDTFNQYCVRNNSLSHWDISIYTAVFTEFKLTTSSQLLVLKSDIYNIIE